MQKLYLSDTDRKIGGVCGGLGEYFQQDPTLFRVIFILISIFTGGLGAIAYFAIWLIIPKKPRGSP